MHRSHRAFTLIELLVAIAIIALLLTLVVVAFRGVRLSANRADSINSLREIMKAYSAYYADHNFDLLPGHPGPNVLASGGGNVDIRAELSDGTLLNAEDTASYVWRLAPYTSDEWQVFYTDYQSQSILSALNTEYALNRSDIDGDGDLDGIYGAGTVMMPEDIGIGRFPSFGLNSIFLGGDSVHGGPDIAARNPFESADSIAVTSMSEVRNPAKVIGFGAAALADTSLKPHNATTNDLVLGTTELRPPYLELDPEDLSWSNQQWEVDSQQQGQAVDGDFAAGGGWPIGRWGSTKVPVGRLDGSAGIADLFQLANDMVNWSPRATGLRAPGG